MNVVLSTVRTLLVIARIGFAGRSACCARSRSALGRHRIPPDQRTWLAGDKTRRPAAGRHRRCGDRKRNGPSDALPALGNDYAVPGYHWGEGRAPALAVTGLDLVYPTPLGGYTRARLRLARTADQLSEMPDSGAWVTGAELGLFWSTPFGAVELAFGANGEGGRRLSLDVGPRF